MGRGYKERVAYGYLIVSIRDDVVPVPLGLDAGYGDLPAEVYVLELLPDILEQRRDKVLIDLELADNHGRERFRNVPIDTLMACMERAVRAGRGVCWEGDVSEPGFSFGRGVALLPAGTPTGQADRQRAFERFLTTDDHCMAIIGLARDASGGRWFICKNSWGTGNPYGGLMYMSEPYFRLNTVAVVMRH